MSLDRTFFQTRTNPCRRAAPMREQRDRKWDVFTLALRSQLRAHRTRRDEPDLTHPSVRKLPHFSSRNRVPCTSLHAFPREHKRCAAKAAQHAQRTYGARVRRAQARAAACAQRSRRWRGRPPDAGARRADAESVAGGAVRPGLQNTLQMGTRWRGRVDRATRPPTKRTSSCSRATTAAAGASRAAALRPRCTSRSTRSLQVCTSTSAACTCTSSTPAHSALHRSSDSGTSRPVLLAIDESSFRQHTAAYS